MKLQAMRTEELWALHAFIEALDEDTATDEIIELDTAIWFELMGRVNRAMQDNPEE